MESKNKESPNIINNNFDNNYQNCNNKMNGEKKEKKKKKKSKNRCFHKDCNKKLTISALKCKCENKFCGLHRLPHQHTCDYIRHISKDDLMKKRGLGGGKFSQLEKV
jgi:predicted nucleic acid binding AN1-type Zn finger protein